MKRIIFSLSILISTSTLFAQGYPVFPNGGFEDWSGSGDLELPVNFHSNKDGSSVAQLGNKTSFKDASIVHSGNYSVRIETVNYVIAVVNGSLTTGFVNAPNTTKANGYIGTTNYSDGSQVRRIAFTGRPDSLVGYFQYIPANDPQEKGKITAVLHNNQYYDPETPTTYHADPTPDLIGRATFITENQTYSNWTRFSVPFNYSKSDYPQYVMITATSSNNQLTVKAGSKLWLDDLEFIYNPGNGTKELQDINVSIYKKGSSVIADLSQSQIEDPEIVVLDLSGKEIVRQQLTANTTNKIDLPLAITNGIYIFKLIGSNAVASGKLMF